MTLELRLGLDLRLQGVLHRLHIHQTSSLNPQNKNPNHLRKRGIKKHESRKERERGTGTKEATRRPPKNKPELQTWWNKSEEKSREEEEDNDNDDDDDDADDDDNYDLVFFFFFWSRTEHQNIQPTSPYQTASTPWQPEAGR
jgi:hypothetical protein